MAKRAARPRPQKPSAPPAPPKPEWILVGLSVIGLAISVYLAWTKWSGGSALFCTAGSACDAVQASRYSVFLGLPVGIWGALFYALVGALAVSGRFSSNWLLVFVVTVAGVAFSAYLTFLELFVIHAICPYCVASALVSVALLSAVVWRRPPGTARRLRPARLVSYGLGTAVVTVIVAAGVYATPTSEDNSYQEALARHLAATGAVMYGAYW